MGQLVVSVVGAGLGFLVGGPVGAKVGFLLGSAIGSTLFAPTIEGPRLTDLRVTASTLGTAIPEMLGTVRLGGNMIWSAGIVEAEENVSQGKGGGPSQKVYTYSATFAMGICAGPIDDLLRIWADGKLIYDKTNGGARRPFSSGADGNLFIEGTGGTGSYKQIIASSLGDEDSRIRLRFYNGSETQLPDSLIVADKGEGNVSAHRGMAYIVAENFALEDFGNRIPQMTFEVTKSPRRAVPILTATEEDGETTFPLSDGDMDWFPDWELGIVFGADGTGSYVFDLDTMQLIYSSDATAGLGWQTDGRRREYLQGEGIWLHTQGLRNSAPLKQWNVLTLSQTGEFGTTSNSVDGSVNYTEGENDAGFNASNSYTIGNLGKIGYCRTGRGSRVYLTMTWTRSVWILRTGLEWPAAGGFKADWEPVAFVEGQTGTGTADIFGWRNSGGEVQIQQWAISGDITFNVITTPTGPDWESSNSYSIDYYDLAPFATPSSAFRDVAWTFTASVCLYDPTDDCILCVGTATSSLGSETAAFKYQRSTSSYKFAVIYFEDEVGKISAPAGRMTESRLRGGSFGWAVRRTSVSSPEGIFEINLQTGDPIEAFAYGGQFGSSSIGLDGSQHWDDGSRSLVSKASGRFVRVFFATAIANLTIADVVRDICLSTRILTTGDIDVTELDNDELTGYVVDRTTTARSVLRQLATGFMFDGFESDYKLVFRSRGRDADVVIPEDWIIRQGEQELVKETVTQELELPMRITVNYYDITRDHNQGSQSHKRISAPFPSMYSQREDVVDLPVTWEPDPAKQAADKLLKMAWAGRTAFEFQLPFRYLKYDPSDVAEIQMLSGTTHTVRMSDTNIGGDFSIQVRGQSEKASAYVSTLSGSIVEAPLQSLGRNYPASVETINTPLLRDIDFDASNNATVYYGVSTLARGFNGATVFVNEGFDFIAEGFAASKLVQGFCQTTLPPTTSWGSTDNTTELFVRLSDQSQVLESVTQEEMLNDGVNAALVNNEIIQFRDAELQDDGTWKLTGLLRARRGTNYAVNDHTQGDVFILLEPAKILADTRPPSNYNTTITTKAVPRRVKLDDAQSREENLLPKDLQPYTPEDVKVTDDDTTVTVSMQRRSRVISPLVANTGTIHYKEGDKSSARISYQVWFGLGIADVTPTTDADLTGNISLFDGAGDDLDAEFTFTIASMGSETSALVRLAEVGIVEGFPKWIEIERVGSDLWNLSELY